MLAVFDDRECASRSYCIGKLGLSEPDYDAGVWRDLRNQYTSGSDIFGARLSSGGAVLEPNGFPICSLAGDQFEPSVAASGGDYLVVWQDTRTVPAPAPLRDQQARIFGTRVTRDGGLLDGPGLMMNSRLLDPDVLAVVGGDAGEFLIVGEGVSDGAFRVVANLFWADFPPRIRFAGTPNGWLVAWPNPSTGFVLQENTNLDSASWVNVATPPMIVGEEKQLIVPARFTNRFYRLRK